MMRMSVSVYWIGYWYQLILLLNTGYWNNRLIWISVKHKNYTRVLLNFFIVWSIDKCSFLWKERVNACL